MIRAALLFDFKEENWPSMDLVGERLLAHLKSDHAHVVHAVCLQPQWQRRLTALPAFNSSHTASNADRLWNRMAVYPRWLTGRTSAFDVFHIIDQSYAHLALSLPARRTVITCHDLDIFRSILEPFLEPRPLWYRAIAHRILRGFRAARHIFFVSETVRREADRLGLTRGTSCSVAHNGVSEVSIDPAAIRAVGKLVGDYTAGHLLLSVGSVVPRKRLDTLLRVFAAVLEQVPDVRLIRVGGALSDEQLALAGSLGVSDAIVELPFLEEPVLAALYRRATLLLQTSQAEGFGLPVAEAMAQGCPVVASDIPVLREIGGEAAIYCPVADVLKWSAAVVDLLRQNQSEPLFWHALQEDSRLNAARFSWGRNAMQIAGVYARLMAE